MDVRNWLTGVFDTTEYDGLYCCPFRLEPIRCPYSWQAPSNPGAGIGAQLEAAFTEHLNDRHPGWTIEILRELRRLVNNQPDTLAYVLNNGVRWEGE